MAEMPSAKYCTIITLGFNTTNKTVSEIAFEVGFESISQFNRTFKKITKTSPTQYKNRITI